MPPRDAARPAPHDCRRPLHPPRTCKRPLSCARNSCARECLCRARVLHQAPDRPADALVRAMARHRTAGAGSGSSRTPLVHPAPLRAPRILLVVIGRRSASASASPSRGPGNGILWAETGGRIQVPNAGERSEFGSQTATRLTNRPKLRGFLQTRKPRRFAGTVWWRTQSRETGLRRPNSAENARSCC